MAATDAAFSLSPAGVLQHAAPAAAASSQLRRRPILSSPPFGRRQPPPSRRSGRHRAAPPRPAPERIPSGSGATFPRAPLPPSAAPGSRSPAPPARPAEAPSPVSRPAAGTRPGTATRALRQTEAPSFSPPAGKLRSGSKLEPPSPGHLLLHSSVGDELLELPDAFPNFFRRSRAIGASARSCPSRRRWFSPPVRPRPLRRPLTPRTRPPPPTEPQDIDESWFRQGRSRSTADPWIASRPRRRSHQRSFLHSPPHPPMPSGPQLQSTSSAATEAIYDQRRRMQPPTPSTASDAVRSLRIKMAPGRKGRSRNSTTHEPIESPMTDYELQRAHNILEKNRMFHHLGLGRLRELVGAQSVVPAREESDPLYEPGEKETEPGDSDTEQGVEKGPELSKSLPSTGGPRASKRVMALQEQDQPTRMTRQRTKEISSANESCPVPTTDQQDGTAEDGLIALDAHTQSDNHNNMIGEEV